MGNETKQGRNSADRGTLGRLGDLAGDERRLRMEAVLRAAREGRERLRRADAPVLPATEPTEVSKAH